MLGSGFIQLERHFGLLGTDSWLIVFHVIRLGLEGRTGNNEPSLIGALLISMWVNEGFVIAIL